MTHPYASFKVSFKKQRGSLHFILKPGKAFFTQGPQGLGDEFARMTKMFKRLRYLDSKRDGVLFGEFPVLPSPDTSVQFKGHPREVWLNVAPLMRLFGVVDKAELKKLVEEK